ncbi:mutS protein homolog 5-like [Diabrotica undecimpunctata]|uniref:mutS protein homolog 5-like n=1 Tax=Diabrotica undecimpunctata TaxID=50387 RepID=UPI003B633CD9
MSSPPTEIITVHQIKGKPMNDTTEEFEEKNDDTINEEPNIFMCVLYRFGKLGVAYYNFVDKQLYVYDEMVDEKPQYLVTVSLFREIKPKYVLTIGGRNEEFTKVLIDIITYGDSLKNSTTTSDNVQPMPPNLFLASIQEYTYEICKAIISQLNLASIEEEPSKTKREVYIHSLINFDNRLPFQAIGTLVKFLDKNWSFFGISEKDDLNYIHINQVTRKDQVLIDNSTFEALQIFSKRGHEAGFKRGLHSSDREGLSVYKLFSVNCKSRVGLVTLRNILLNPLKNIDLLNQRLDFISFVLLPSNRFFVESLRENLQEISGDINVILTRIGNSRAKFRDWYVLYKTIYHTVYINELSAPYRENCSLLFDLCEAISPNLISLEESIKNGLDFDVSKKRGKPIVRSGLDEDLDEKKLRRQGIMNDVMAAARFAADNLPDFLDECSVVYLPEMGHLLAIKEWKSDCQPEDLQYLGFQYVFKIGGKFHYKNPMCVELDKRLGDIYLEIIDHENRILRRLSGFILKYNKDIREPLKIIGMIDSLIAMAIAASCKMYVRPFLNTNNYFQLDECRHPLLEHMLEQFQPNDFYSGANNSHIKIITGPNGSGKSVYLKQICLVVYLAHVGSYVPCSRADINLLDTMHSRVLAMESAAVRLSSFMIDVTQMNNTLTDRAASSLVLVDEFGNGTSETEGICLLQGVLEHFLERGAACPHILVSSHFQQIHKRLPDSPLIQYQKMEHTKESGVLYFLYKITEGISNSYAFDVAEEIGIDKKIIDRAKEIFDCLSNKKSIAPLPKLLSRNKFDMTTLQILDIPEPDEDNEHQSI